MESKQITPQEIELKRRWGISEACTLGIGAMVGAGIFVLSGTAIEAAGPAVLISFILAAGLQVMIGLCYAELASIYPKAGGAYYYTSELLGSFTGTIAGWAYWGAWLAASSFVAQGFGQYVHALTGAPPLASAVLLLIALGMINIFGVVVSGVLQVAIVALVIFMIGGLSFYGLPHISFSLYEPFMPNGISGTMQGVLIGFLALVGWDAIVDAGEEIRTPERTIPRAILAAVMIVLVLYTGLLAAMIGTVPWQKIGASDVPVALVSEQLIGSYGPVLVSLMIICTLPATANAFIISISRTALAMGRRGLLPSVISRIHPRLGTPVSAIILGVVIQVLFTICSSINIAVSATGFLYLLTFVCTLLAFFRARRLFCTHNGYRAPLYPLLPAIALLFSLFLLVTVGRDGIKAGCAWLSIGLVLYIFRFLKNKK